MNKTLLFIEDEQAPRKIYSELLKTAKRLFPHEVTIAEVETIAQADALCETMIFDAILLDLGLPDSHSEKTKARIPEFRERWKAPIFVVTGDEFLQTRDECLRLGADDFTTKIKLVESPGCIMERLYNMIVKFRSHDTKV